METAKQITLVTSDPWLLENGGLWSWQGSSEDIQDRIERCDLYQERLGSVNERRDIIYGLGWMWQSFNSAPYISKYLVDVFALFHIGHGKLM